MPMKDEAMKDETTTLALDFPNGLPRMPAFDPGCRRAIRCTYWTCFIGAPNAAK